MFPGAIGEERALPGDPPGGALASQSGFLLFDDKHHGSGLHGPQHTELQNADQHPKHPEKGDTVVG